MTTNMTGWAHAKVNWTLAVLHRREDGYHEIDTVMQTLALADKVELFASGSGQVRVSGPYAQGVPTDERNLACQAAQQYAAWAGLERGFGIALEKNIPSQAGLGGGSSDAATVLRLLELEHHKLGEVRLRQLAATLGADVPFFLGAAAARCRGAGERLMAIAAQPFWLLLAMGGGGAATPAVYGRWDEQGQGGAAACPERTLRALAAGDARGLGAALYNHLEAAACALQPDIGRTLCALGERKPLAAGMSGSGAACFALFERREQAERAAAGLKMDFVCVTHSLHSPGQPAADKSNS